MQGVFAPARRRAVQTLRLAFMTAPLCLGDLILDVAVKAPRLELLPVAGRHGVFEPQIQSHRLVPGDRRLELPLDGKAQPPVPHRVLRKAAAFPSRGFKKILLEYPNRLAGKAQ